MKVFRRIIGLFVATLVLGNTAVQGQYLSLWRSTDGASLQLNVDRLWSYNLYEHSRWGLGMRYVWSSGSSVEAYGAYGVNDRRLKGGVAFDLPLPSSHRGGHLYGALSHDYESAASRGILTSGTWASSGNNSSSLLSSLQSPIASLQTILSSRMVELTAARLGYGWQSQTMGFGIELSAFAGQHLFDSVGPLFYVAGDTLPPLWGAEGRLLWCHRSGVTAELKGGMVWPERQPYARLLVHYDRRIVFAPFHYPLVLTVHSQAGATTPNTPYFRQFDLGGTWGAPICFDHSLLTARPYEFTADYFALFALRLMPRDPLFNGWNRILQLGTAPRPFVGLDAAVGHPAPNQGLAEPVVGVDGLLLWGVMRLGVALAYRLTPASAPYHLTESNDNLAVLMTAQLNI